MCFLLADRSDDNEPCRKPLPEKITSVEQLFGTLPNGIELLDEARTERLSSD